MPRLREPAIVVARFLQDAEIAASFQESTPLFADEEYGLWEIVVPTAKEMCDRLAEAPLSFGAADPVDPYTPVFYDVIAFFPIPVPEWQVDAKSVLRDYETRWRTELSRVQARYRSAVMCSLPFAQLLVGSVDDWVSSGEAHDVIISEYVDGWPDAGERGSIAYVRRPYIAWPRPAGSDEHVTMAAMRDEIQALSVLEFKIERPSLRSSVLRP